MRSMTDCFAMQESPEDVNLIAQDREKEPLWTVSPGVEMPPTLGSEPPDDLNRLSSDREAGNMENELPKAKVIMHPQPLRSKTRFKVLQQFEGVVQSFEKNEWTAWITDKTDSGRGREDVTFSTEEIPEPDRELAAPGAVFYWSIGYKDSADGQRERVSAIRFRRIPVWKKSDLAAAKEKAHILGKTLGWTDTDTPRSK